MKTSQSAFYFIALTLFFLGFNSCKKERDTGPKNFDEISFEYIKKSESLFTSTESKVTDQYSYFNYPPGKILLYKTSEGSFGENAVFDLWQQVGELPGND